MRNGEVIGTRTTCATCSIAAQFLRRHPDRHGIAIALLADMSTDSTTHTRGELCVGGDWACTNGDLETLGYVAGHLAT